MSWTPYAKEQGYDKGTTAPLAATSAPPAAMIASALHQAEDLAAEVQRFLDRLLGAMPEGETAGTVSKPNQGMVPELLEAAHGTANVVGVAHRRLVNAAEYLGLLHGGRVDG